MFSKFLPKLIFLTYPLNPSAHIFDGATLSSTHSRRFRLTLLEIMLASAKILSKICRELKEFFPKFKNFKLFYICLYNFLS
jgi:hypothetical protein